MKKQLFYLLALLFVVVMGCQKETSFESDSTPAEGSLQSDINGDCLPKTVSGVYVAAKPLVADTNKISVSVNVVKTGTYDIRSDTVNGYYFRGTGIFTTTGVNTVTLKGNGTPFAAGVNNFVITFDSTVCDIQITVLPAGAGGPATFTLVNGGTPPNCASAVVNGTYTNNVALTAANTATITVNVTAIGTYNITATGGGMTFTGTGSFLTLGNQPVTLTGSGTPTTTGANTVTFAAPFASCSFIVDVVGPCDGTLGGAPGACTPSLVSGIYVVGSALSGAGNNVQIQVTITTAGSYNISTNTVAGITFSGTGSIAVGPNQNINLVASGTPTAAGLQTFTITFGTSTCTFTVNVLPNDYFPRTVGSNWSYEINDDANDSLLRFVHASPLTTPSNTYARFMQNDGTGPDSSGYYRKNGGDYFEWFDYAGFIGYDNPTEAWAEYIMLKDNVPATTNWKSPGFAGTFNGPPPQSLNLRFSYTITDKDVPITITSSTGSVTYQNVIVVEEKYELEATPGNWVQISTGANGIGFGKSYYARGIGLILYEAYDNTSVKTDWFELRRWQIL